jgi:hypothetical protein
MSSIWESGDPLTTPPRWVSGFAGLAMAALALGSLGLGLAAGWQRGASHEGGGPLAATPDNTVEAAPINEPEVSLRDPNAPPGGSTNAAEAPKVATPPAGATNSAHRDEAGPPEEEAAPAPTVAAPSQPPTVHEPVAPAPDAGTPSAAPDAGTPATGGSPQQPAAPF